MIRLFPKLILKTLLSTAPVNAYSPLESTQTATTSNKIFSYGKITYAAVDHSEVMVSLLVADFQLLESPIIADRLRIFAVLGTNH
jgi:hypothetical protein